ncbi:XRE family transcriptional regulator [Aestuariivita sp.]|jgi:phage repressor protein C with HTH and peptisase S24 domain|uniref:XRE family transcriptional regulator n=1 Tax=Aestuariivita sp. TaxID=1872407 RepID=UPI00216CE393|nr:XRE family transcriptional regulator [Aestuariivita sp.]MCE8007133.1 helix-turn-helix transcriptional regulator [Aestuariivita sp.]
MSENPGKRLALFRKKIGLNQRDFAYQLGFSPGRVGSIESGASAPSRNFLERMSERYRVNADWLLYGRGEMLHDQGVGFAPANPTRPNIKPPDRAMPMGGDFVSGDQAFSFVRQFELRASAGPGAVVESEDSNSQIAFTRKWLLARGLAPDLCGLVHAKGTSMEPVIPDGALMLVAFNVMPPIEPGIYVYRDGDDIYVKHLTVLEKDGFDRPTKVLATSQDPSLPPVVLAPSDDNAFRILARVVSVISDIRI